MRQGFPRGYCQIPSEVVTASTALSFIVAVYHCICPSIGSQRHKSHSSVLEAKIKIQCTIFLSSIFKVLAPTDLVHGLEHHRVVELFVWGMLFSFEHPLLQPVNRRVPHHCWDFAKRELPKKDGLISSSIRHSVCQMEQDQIVWQSCRETSVVVLKIRKSR